MKRDLDSLSEFMARWLSGTAAGARRSSSRARATAATASAAFCGRSRSRRESGSTARSSSRRRSRSPRSTRPTTTSSAGSTGLPTMAAAAVHHGRSRAFPQGAPLEDVLREAEEFATGDYTAFLTRGASMPAEERERVLARMADLIGLPVELVERSEGRIHDPRLLARAAARPAEGPRALRRDDHRDRPVPRPRGLRRARSDALRASAPRTRWRSTACSARRSASRPTASTPSAQLRGEPGVEARRRAPRVPGARGRDRRLPLRDGAEPAREGLRHARPVRPRDAVLRERPPAEPHALRSRDGRPAHGRALRRRAHVLRVGVRAAAASRTRSRASWPTRPT